MSDLLRVNQERDLAGERGFKINPRLALRARHEEPSNTDFAANRFVLLNVISERCAGRGRSNLFLLQNA